MRIRWLFLECGSHAAARGQMRIHVTLYGELRRYHPQRGPVDAADGATVAALLAMLGVDDRHPRLVAVNDETVDEDHVLVDGDHLEAFHAVAGG